MKPNEYDQAVKVKLMRFIVFWGKHVKRLSTRALIEEIEKLYLGNARFARLYSPPPSASAHPLSTNDNNTHMKVAAR